MRRVNKLLRSYFLMCRYLGSYEQGTLEAWLNVIYSRNVHNFRKNNKKLK